MLCSDIAVRLLDSFSSHCHSNPLENIGTSVVSLTRSSINLYANTRSQPWKYLIIHPSLVPGGQMEADYSSLGACGIGQSTALSLAMPQNVPSVWSGVDRSGWTRTGYFGFTLSEDSLT